MNLHCTCDTELMYSTCTFPKLMLINLGKFLYKLNIINIHVQLKMLHHNLNSSMVGVSTRTELGAAPIWHHVANMRSVYLDYSVHNGWFLMPWICIWWTLECVEAVGLGIWLPYWQTIRLCGDRWLWDRDRNELWVNTYRSITYKSSYMRVHR